MNALDRETLRHAAVGFLVGAVLGYVPLVTLVAPLLGGGVAGYLERENPRRGAVAGAVAGAFMAAFSAIVTNAILFARFGEFPFAGSPLQVVGLVAALSLVGALGQVLVAAVGGALGAILGADRPRAAERRATPGQEPREGRTKRVFGAVVGLVLGVVTFGAVALGVTVALDPFIWLSALVGLPAGFIAGSAVAVLAYHLLTTPPEARRIGARAVGGGAVALLVVFAAVVGGLSLLGDRQIEQTTDSTYEYDVGLSTDATVENATLYLPLPVEGDDAPLGEYFVENVQYDRYTPAVRGYEPDPAPVNFTYAIVETEHGPMLAVSADRIAVETIYYREVENGTMGWYERIDRSEYDPGDPSMGVRNDGSFAFTVTVAANDTVDTADPFDDEPLLSPKYDRTPTECIGPTTDDEQCYTYESRMYASYAAPENATVQLNVGLNGRNEWFSGGWTGNEYRDRTNLELTGPQDGWFVTEGWLDVAVGSYR